MTSVVRLPLLPQVNVLELVGMLVTELQLYLFDLDLHLIKKGINQRLKCCWEVLHNRSLPRKCNARDMAAKLNLAILGNYFLVLNEVRQNSCTHGCINVMLEGLVLEVVIGIVVSLAPVKGCACTIKSNCVKSVHAFIHALRFLEHNLLQSTAKHLVGLRLWQAHDKASPVDVWFHNIYLVQPRLANHTHVVVLSEYLFQCPR
mmetsp:Transcript_69924/g.167847  ORF Transcript_69924/g.167847 Transcript_69924/m.167847 type:complete len:203 (+) Transcript_69924:250-858(+)